MSNTDDYSPETTAALSAIIAKQPFFATLLFDLCVVKEDDKTETAATDGRNILVGPWFRERPIAERVFVLCHEIMHCVLHHLPRAKMYQERSFGPDMKPWSFPKWNQATDYVINDTLIQSKVGTMPKVGLHNTSIATSADLADDIYQKLPEPPPQDGDGEGEGFDKHIIPKDSTAVPTEQEAKRGLTAAANAAKATGTLPGALARLVGSILDPVMPWQELLRDYITATVGTGDTSWVRPNRRRLALPPNVPFPGQQGWNMGAMVVAIDTSGSISEKELTAFVSEMAGIIDQVKPRELWACYWDTVGNMVQIDSIEQLESERVEGGGGTIWDCVPRAIDDAEVEPELVVTMTDGYVQCSADRADWAHLCVTTAKDFPFGKTIKMNA